MTCTTDTSYTGVMRNKAAYYAGVRASLEKFAIDARGFAKLEAAYRGKPGFNSAVGRAIDVENRRAGGSKLNPGGFNLGSNLNPFQTGAPVGAFDATAIARPNRNTPLPGNITATFIPPKPQQSMRPGVP